MTSPSLPMVSQWLEIALDLNHALEIVPLLVTQECRAAELESFQYNNRYKIISPFSALPAKSSCQPVAKQLSLDHPAVGAESQGHTPFPHSAMFVSYLHLKLNKS